MKIPTPLGEAREPLAMVTDGKKPEVEMEEKRDSLLEMWLVTLELRHPEVNWVRPANEGPVYATKEMEPNSWCSSYQMVHTTLKRCKKLSHFEENGLAKAEADFGTQDK